MRKIFVFLVFALVLSRPCQAEERVCVVASAPSGAWLIQKNSVVKSTLSAGDPIYEGDRLVVTQGNAIQLAMDEGFENTLEVQGASDLRFSRGHGVDLTNGRVYALFNRSPGGEFSINSPVAISATRAAKFQVRASGDKADVNTYAGEVQVSGRDASGSPAGDPVIVAAGQKTSVSPVGQPPQVPSSMAEYEKSEILPVAGRMDEARRAFSEARRRAQGEPIGGKEFKADEKSKGLVLL